MNHINVVVLTSSYPRFEGDNSSVFLQHLNTAILKKGIKIHVVAPASDGVDEQVNDGIRIHRFKYVPRRMRKLCYGSGILSNLENNPFLWFLVPFFLISMSITLIRLAKKTNANIIHCHWLIPQGLVAVVSRPFHRAKIIVTAHGSDVFDLSSPLSRLLKRLVIRRSDMMTANTNATAQAALTSIDKPELRVIPMGVSARLFEKGNRNKLRHNFPGNKKILLFVGRLIKEKGASNLIHSFSLLPDDVRRNTLLWLVGDGNLRDNLEAEAARLNLTEQIVFWGAQPNERLPDYFSAADIFICPSETEGQGVVILEAFASGTPVIASNVGGIPDIVTHMKTGILVPPNNSELLSREIYRMMDDQTLRKKLAGNAKHEVRRKYDWEVVSDQFMQLYSDLLKNSRLETT